MARARRTLKRLYGEDFDADAEEAEFQAPALKLRGKGQGAAILGFSMTEPIICLD